MKSGMIYLYSSDGNLARYKQYNSVHERRNIIETWEKLSGAEFANCFIQISPTVKDEEEYMKMPLTIRKQYHPEPAPIKRTTTQNSTPYNIKPLYNYDS